MGNCRSGVIISINYFFATMQFLYPPCRLGMWHIHAWENFVLHFDLETDIKMAGLFASHFSTPTVTLVEPSQVEIEQFLAMLRFENRKKLEELPVF